MGKKVLLDVQLTIASHDLTNWTSKLELNDTFEDKDITTYGSGGAKEVLGGLEEGKISITFKNDYAAGQLDEIMWGLRRQVVDWLALPGSGAVSTSNPGYGGQLLVNSWNPIAGSVGDVAEVDVQFTLSGPMERITS
jgi:hypothetical protein